MLRCLSCSILPVFSLFDSLGTYGRYFMGRVLVVPTAILATVCLLFSFSSSAETASVPGSEFVDVHAETHQNAVLTDVKPLSPLQQSLQKVRGLRDDIEQIEAQLAVAEGEDFESLSLRKLDKRAELLAVLTEMSKRISVRRSEGENAAKLLGDFRGELLATGKVLRAEIDGYEKRFDSRNRERDNLTSAGIKAYVQGSKQIDAGIENLGRYADLVERMGFGAQPSVEYLREKTQQRAELLAGRVRLAAELETETKKLLAARVDDPELKLRLALIGEKLAADTTSLRKIIAVADRYGIDISGYQKLLIKTTGQIGTGVLNKDVVLGLLHDWWGSSLVMLSKNSGSILFKVIILISLLLLFRLLAAFVGRVVRRSVQSSKVSVSVLMQDMLVSMASRLVLLIGLLIALAQIGVSLGPVLAGLGVAGFIVGFALQDTLGNFAAGMMILVYRPYDVGDFVEAAGVSGLVKSMSIVSTTILTVDNQTLIIPNSKIWGDVIKNVTAQGERRVDMMFGISYSDSVEDAERLLHDIVTSNEKVLAEPAPVIRLHQLGDSSVNFIVRPWVKTADYWEVYWYVTKAVKLRFDAEGISIPFPQRDVHIHQSAEK